MSLANNALLNTLAIFIGTPVQDDETAGGPGNVTTQAGATAVVGEAVRVTRAPTIGNSMILKSVLSGDASPLTFVINDSANSINVFPATGETNNGGLNQVLAVPAGQSGIFVRVPNNLAGSSSGWRSAVIP